MANQWDCRLRIGADRQNFSTYSPTNRTSLNRDNLIGRQKVISGSPGENPRIASGEKRRHATSHQRMTRWVSTSPRRAKGASSHEVSRTVSTADSSTTWRTYSRMDSPRWLAARAARARRRIDTGRGAERRSVGSSPTPFEGAMEWPVSLIAWRPSAIRRVPRQLGHRRGSGHPRAAYHRASSSETVKTRTQSRQTISASAITAPGSRRAAPPGERSCEARAARSRRARPPSRASRSSMKKGWGEPEWLFPSKTNTHLHHNHVAKRFKKALKDAKLPGFRVYDLRHTYASLLLAHGAPIS